MEHKAAIYQWLFAAKKYGRNMKGDVL